MVVDNTFATPINQSPLALGADLVIHSATKFLGGHADALGGVVCGRRDLVSRVFHDREITGASLHPEAAYLLLRGMKTLHLRIRQQNESALQVSRFLEGHPLIEKVYYPGLESHPQRELARRQMRGGGGVVSFLLAGGFEAVRSFLPRLRLAHRAANPGRGGNRGRASGHHQPRGGPQRAPRPDGDTRGARPLLEDTEDLIEDLRRALSVSPRGRRGVGREGKG